MRSFRLSLWVLAPEKGISNIDVSCSAVGLRTLSKKERNSGLLGCTGGSGSGITSTIGGGVGPGVGGVGFGEGPGGCVGVGDGPGVTLGEGPGVVLGDG